MSPELAKIKAKFRCAFDHDIDGEYDKVYSWLTQKLTEGDGTAYNEQDRSRADI